MLMLLTLLAAFEQHSIVSCRSAGALGMCPDVVRQVDAVAPPIVFLEGTHAAHAAPRDEVDAIGPRGFLATPGATTSRKAAEHEHVDGSQVDTNEFTSGDSDLLGGDGALKALGFAGVVSAGAGLWVLGVGAPVTGSALSRPAAPSEQSTVLGAVLMVAGAAAFTTAIAFIVLDDAPAQDR